MVVSSCLPLGDAVCPHCGSLVFPSLQREHVHGDVEKALADRGILVETNDDGEITKIQLHGPRFDDRSIQWLASLGAIPIITLCNTALSQLGIERLRLLLPDSHVEESL